MPLKKTSKFKFKRRTNKITAQAQENNSCGKTGQAELGLWAACCSSIPCIGHFCWGSCTKDASQREGQREREL